MQETWSWKFAFTSAPYRKHFTLTLVLLLLCAIVAPFLFDFIEHRSGIALTDPVLVFIEPRDLSVLIFSILYVLILAGVVSMARSPLLFLQGLQGFFLLTVMRFTTLLLTPLEPPAEIQFLNDPFIQELFYRQTITKDLFFSGHAGILFLFYFLHSDSTRWRRLFFGGAVGISLLLLIQHVHYTIDVLAAPAFAWVANNCALRLCERITADP